MPAAGSRQTSGRVGRSSSGYDRRVEPDQTPEIRPDGTVFPPVTPDPPAPPGAEPIPVPDLVPRTEAPEPDAEPHSEEPPD